MPRFSIRPLAGWDELLACERLQIEVWGMPDRSDVVPASLLSAAQKNGGTVLGAFDPDERLVGFVFGFPGVHSELKSFHYSHMLGVLPEWRGQGIGALLKLAQRDQVLGQGITLITWTFDPLQATNGRFNLVRLGALARTYIQNAYGTMTDSLNAGVASDRFLAEWCLDSPRVRKALGPGLELPRWRDYPQALDLRWTRSGLPEIRAILLPDEGPFLAAIPPDWNRMRAESLILANEWRTVTRQLFQQAFANGLAALGLIEAEEGERFVPAYLFAVPSPQDPF